MRSRWMEWLPGTARTLGCALLSMALSGCGGGDEAGGGGGESEDAAKREALATASAQGDSCPPPPPAPDSLFHGAWQRLSGFVASSGVTFPDAPGNSEMRRVQLCDSCDVVRVTLRSGSATHCLEEGELNGEPRIAGIYILHENFPAQHGFGPFAANDSVLVFASSQDAPARLAFKHADTVAVAPDGSWRFHYCNDAHRSGKPEAGWRDPRSGKPLPPDPGGGGQAEPGGGSYGWMACANGCCQFYTPPPGDQLETPKQANDAAPDIVGRGAKHPPCTEG